MAIDFNTSPYYDDYNDDNDFYRMLFKPGFAVQARELTQLQTILQNQVARFGNHVFKEGSKVSGAEIFVDKNVRTVRLKTTYSGNNITVSAFKNKFAKGATSGFIGEVKHVYSADTPTVGDPPTIIVKPLNTENTTSFSANEDINFYDTFLDALNDTNVLTAGASVALNTTITKTGSSSIYSKEITVSSIDSIVVGDKVTATGITKDLFVVSIGTSSVTVNEYAGVDLASVTFTFTRLACTPALEVAVTEGIFYKGGIFVRNSSQSLIPSKYNAYPTTSVGFKVSYDLISSEDDSTLLDPALDSTNYFAPGADRYKITLTLTAVDVVDGNPDIDDAPNYLEIVRIKEGQVQRENTLSVYNELGKAIARRTFDESGNYIVKNFILYLNDTTDAATTINADVLPGKAYVKGYEIETIAPTRITIDKARDTENVAGFDISPFYGNYTVVDGPIYSLSSFGANIELHSNTTPSSSTLLGTAHVKHIEYDTGSTTSTNYKLFLHDINITDNTFGNVRAFVTTSVAGNYDSANLTFQANVDSSAITANVTQLTESAYDTLLFNIPQQNISEVTDTTYTFRKIYPGVSFTAGNATITTASSAEDFVGGSGTLSSSVAREYYYVVAKTASGTFTKGQYIPIDGTGRSVTLPVVGAGSPGQANFNLNDNTFNGTADIVATIEVTSDTRRSKTLVANAVLDVNIAAANTYYSFSKSDIYQLNKVYKYGSNAYLGAWVSGNTYYSSNVVVYSGLAYQANATSTGTVPLGNVSSWTPMSAQTSSLYELDNGQRDNYYDHGRVKFVGGGSAPGNVIIAYDYFTHGGGSGFFTVDSYPIDYSDIPSYVSKKTGTTYKLADVYDFRPRRTDGAATITFDTYQIPTPYSFIESDHAYYMGRIDKVALSPNGDFKVIKGVSSFINPGVPVDDQDAMTLFVIKLPPYTASSSDVSIEYVPRRRYTMKDIGQIDQRLKSVEYYTALSFLEKEVLAADVLDTTNSALFKNGYLVDSFAGHSVGDVLNPDYKCSIDFLEGFVRAPFDSTAYKFTFDPISNPDVVETGNLISLPYVENVFVQQNVATKIINVNPFNVVNFIGRLKITPASDIWYDTVNRPIVNIVNEGDKDAWIAAENAAGTQWNDWQLNWSGQSTRTDVISDNGSDQVLRDTTTTTTTFTRSGIQTTVGTRLVINSDSTEIVSQEVIPFARQKTISFEVFGMPPVTTLYLFANNSINLTEYITPDGGSLGDDLISDLNGYAKGTFVLPNNSTIRVPTGKIRFTLTNNNNSLAEATAYAEAGFVASGTLNTEQRTIVSTREPVLLRNVVTDSRTEATQTFNTRRVSSPVTWVDPLAETFLVDSGIYPNGIYLSSVDLYFATKDSTLPVWIQIRPTENGLPSSSVVVPLSEVYKNPSDINIPDSAEIYDGIGQPTNFSFESPVYLAPGEYCLVVLSNSDRFNLYAAEIGQTQLGTTTEVTSQPYLGVLFKSQNGSSWTPSQSEDLCFRLNKCKFNRGTKNFELSLEAPDGSFDYDLIKLSSQELNFGNETSVTYEVRTRPAGSGTLNSYINVPFGQNYELNETMNATTAGDILVRATVNSTSENVSPVVDLERINAILVKNKIDSSTNTILTSELNSAGGLAQAKYITRRVTLSEGLDATGLNVNLLINRRPGTDIKVYYKVLNKYDSTSFDNRPYVLMSRTNLSGDVIFTDNPDQYSEENYQALDISYTNGTASYNDFKVFAIKIVFFSSNQSVVPKIKALRVTAVS